MELRVAPFAYQAYKDVIKQAAFRRSMVKMQSMHAREATSRRRSAAVGQVSALRGDRQRGTRGAGVTPSKSSSGRLTVQPLELFEKQSAARGKLPPVRSEGQDAGDQQDSEGSKSSAKSEAANRSSNFITLSK